LDRILLIDDHSSMGVIFKTLLTAMGCAPSNFVFCQDVESARENLRESPAYDLIFLDHFVPPTYDFRDSLVLLSGVDAGTPIVLLSGTIPEDFGTHAIDARISRCLHKDDISVRNLHHLLTELDVPLAS
tara:strand:+ start:2378 stop:2764 length:387 start_codon:yes stop_codon:yes gene_type:complete